MSHTETLAFDNARIAQALFVNEPKNLKRLGEKLGVRVNSRDGWIKIAGPRAAVLKARQIFEELHRVHTQGQPIRREQFDFAIEAVTQKKSVGLTDLHSAKLEVSAKKPSVIPKSPTQKNYLESIHAHDLTFGIGPAGTGKTYLAVAAAVASLKREQVKRIILTRPAVEAGEALGFLPGDLQEKILPYLRPLYDALHDMMDPEEIQRHVERGNIEIAPLAYMRGRTLSQSFIILDEAQNTSTEQMFMFLTRLGPGSRCVITGDPTQIDLPRSRKSGLVEAVQALKGVEGMAFCEFNEEDVVRHVLVQRIIRAYRSHRGEKMTSLTL